MAAPTKRLSVSDLASDWLRRRQILVCASPTVTTLGLNPASAWAARRVESRVFPVAKLPRLDINIPCTARLFPSLSPMLRITAEREVLAALRVGVVKDVLTIDSLGFQSTQPVELEYGFHELHELKLSAAGEAQLRGVTADKLVVSIGGSAQFHAEHLNLRALRVDIQGAGDAQVSGSAVRSEVRLSGGGSYAGRDLVAQDVFVNLSGAGDVHVQAKRTLSVILSGAGDVVYEGQPVISQRVDGAGAVLSAARRSPWHDRE